MFKRFNPVKSLKFRFYRSWGRRLNLNKGWRSKWPILVIESDDWGAEHIPGPDDLIFLTERGCIPADYLYRYDGLEKVEDVTKLCEILSSFKDGHGKPAIVTSNFIMANPDYTGIKESGYGNFVFRPINKGWNHEGNYKLLWESYLKAINAGLLVPQFHGLLHFRPDNWIKKLRKGDYLKHLAFEKCSIGVSTDYTGIGTEIMSGIYLTEKREIEYYISNGVEIFRKAFNFDSLTTIAPCYAWRTPETESLLSRYGFRAIQGKEFQYMGENVLRVHYLGQRGPGGMIYLTRNCTLEPVVADTTAGKCIQEIKKAFEASIPAIVCSHRVNYTSRVSATARDKGLKILKQVLEWVVKEYPKVEFLSSDKLALRIFENRQ